MIASSRGLKLFALTGALIVHGALAAGLIREEPVLVEGSGSEAAALGTSFADMAVGTQTAEETTEVVEPETVPDQPVEAEPEQTVEAEPEPLTPPEPPAEVAQTDPVEDTVAEPAEVAPLAVPETADGVLALQPEPLTPAPVVPEALAALPETLTDPAPEPVTPTEPLAAQPVQPEDTISVLDPDSTVPKLSKRPVRRDPEMETPVKRAEAPKPKPKPKPQQTAKGNNTQNAAAGTTRGASNNTNTRQGAGQAQSKQAGSAAVSNYPGLVNRHLSRIRKPSLSRRGVVRVSFAIASSGGLAGVSVSRSSGSTQLDQAAATLIRRAAPFPKPPAGAQRNFSINIEFR